jgi:hypothetical protein
MIAVILAGGTGTDFGHIVVL